tara:strand:+ start:244 stop:588 length:345 start_codon:yes stop_codon:yes gene_type:complete
MMDNNKIASELLKVARELSSTDKISRRTYFDIIPDEQKNKALYEDLLELAEDVYSKWDEEYSDWREGADGYGEYGPEYNQRDIDKGIAYLSRTYGAKKRDIKHYLMLEIAEIAD